mmetsp:Transcript_1540/g.2040  ORF Transcript_1540/g.2040 Transcript_1540/m.2040 type:complete len:402 (+) Transcript_1540:75-1280(+)
MDSKGLVKVFFRDGTFKTFSIFQHTTAAQLCSMFAKKMHLSGRHFSLLEVTHGSERTVSGNEYPLLILQYISNSKLNREFGQSRENGFVCTFKAESLKSLKDKIRSRRETFGTDNSPRKIHESPSAEKLRFGEEQLLREFDSLKKSLQYDFAHGRVGADNNARTATNEKSASRVRALTTPSLPIMSAPPKPNPVVPVSPGAVSTTSTRQAKIPTLKKKPSQQPTHVNNTFLSTSCPEPSPLKSHEAIQNSKLSKIVSEWSVADVTTWLLSHDLDEYCSSFQKEEIDGLALLSLTESDFKELGVKIGHRKKIFRSLVELSLTNTTTTKHIHTPRDIPDVIEIQDDLLDFGLDEEDDLDKLIEKLDELSAVDAIAQSENLFSVSEFESLLMMLAKQQEMLEEL